MEISVNLGEFDFDIELDIITYPSYRPATRNHPEEGEDSEYKIESCNHMVSFTGKEWREFDSEDKQYYSDLVMKANELKHNDHDDKDHEIILEAIEKELVLEAKYSMEP